MENLTRRIESINMTDIPKTFQDAVLITRKLGYRYLWIDSLCIIQDSASDWQIESVKMADIYFNAVVNISADASPRSDSGIFATSNHVRPRFKQLPIQSPKHDVHTHVYAYVDIETQLDQQSRVSNKSVDRRRFYDLI